MVVEFIECEDSPFDHREEIDTLLSNDFEFKGIISYRLGDESHDLMLFHSTSPKSQRWYFPSRRGVFPLVKVVNRHVYEGDEWSSTHDPARWRCGEKYTLQEVVHHKCSRWNNSVNGCIDCPMCWTKPHSSEC